MMEHSTRALALFVTVLCIIVWTYAWTHGQRAALLPPLTLSQQIAVNKVDAATMQLLPGIGPGLARNLIETRRREGPFRTALELESTPLVGPRTRSRIEPFVKFD